MDIKEYLTSYNIKQCEFAKNIGISKAHLSMIANRKRNPSIPLAKKIVRITEGKVDALKLLGFTTQEKEN